MKHVINHHVVLSQVPEGPLAPWLEGFAEVLSGQGYARWSIKNKIRLAASFSRWLGQEEIDPDRVNSEHPAQYLRYRAQHLASHDGAQSTLRHFLDYLRIEAVIPADTFPARSETDVQRCVRDYEHYLREVCGLAPGSIQGYVLFARIFLEHRFGTEQVTFSNLLADDVVGFVRDMASRMTKKRAKFMTAALRSFLRYVRYREGGVPDLVAAVPAVANWSMTSVPRAIGADQVQQLLASIDRTTVMGRRDYAIMLLLARLGLRANEVAFLELDDIDWRAATLHVRTKGGGHNDFPLSHEAGEAIADYLRHGRPSSDSQRVFLRARAPICGFRSSDGVRWVIKSAIKRTGIDTPTHGTHQFRHGLSVEMMPTGPPWPRSVTCWAIATPTPPGFTPRWIWTPCAALPCRGREVRDEHASRSRRGVPLHAASSGFQAATSWTGPAQLRHVHGTA